MRETKFRAWDKGNKRIVEVEDISWAYDSKSRFISAIKVYEDVEDFCEMYTLNIGDFELLQFTGLKDRKGNEIYEGDILEYAGRNVEVIFEKATASFRVKTSYLISQISKMMKAQLKVIGNIYENRNSLDANHNKRGVKKK